MTKKLDREQIEERLARFNLPLKVDEILRSRWQVKRDETPWLSAPGYTVETTHFGRVRISVHDDWIACLFLDAEKWKGSGANELSGRWNWHPWTLVPGLAARELPRTWTHTEESIAETLGSMLTRFELAIIQVIG